MEAAIIDTHAHIYLEHFKMDINEVVSRCIDVGVQKVYLPNIDHTTIDSMLELEMKYPDVCVPMMGLHPCSVKKDFERELYLVEEWLDKHQFVAVGEMGTDLHWDDTFWKEQQEAFRVQVDMAKNHDLPIVIHCRDTLDLTIEMVKEYKAEKGVFHCFTGTIKQANLIEKLGFFLGIGGVSTFKNSGMDEVIPLMNLDYLVLETDSPYLAPAPFRGKRNEPSYLPRIVDSVSDLLKISRMKVMESTTKNALKLFNKNNGS